LRVGKLLAVRGKEWTQRAEDARLPIDERPVAIEGEDVEL